MASFLGFNSRIVASLLDSSHSHLFESRVFDEGYGDLPLFYKNKISKGPVRYSNYYYRTALEIALKNNQRQAIDEIIAYIVKYQNNITSSF